MDNTLEKNLRRAKHIVLTRRILISIFATSLFVVSLFILNTFAQTSPKQNSLIITLTNQERINHGLSPLKSNIELQHAAENKAKDMFAHQYFEHVSPTGATPWDFITKSGYNYSYAGENLAIDFNDLTQTHQAWMKSPSHRDNILDSHYHEIGIASVSGQFQGHPTIITVEMFGSNIVDSTLDGVFK